MEPRNRLQGMNSANLCSLAGRYDNFILTRFLAPIDCLQIPAQHWLTSLIPRWDNSITVSVELVEKDVAWTTRHLKGQCHEYFFGWSECFNEYPTFCACADCFQGLSKAFHYPIQISTFYLLLLICKFLMKPSSKFSSLWLVDILRCRPLIGCRENAQEIMCHRQLPVWFYRITGGLLNGFSVSKSPLWSLWRGYNWKDFSKLESDFKGAS